MAELTEDRAADYAHILADLHAMARQHAGQDAVLDRIETLLKGFAERLDALDELLPAAKRAAAMLDTPVTAFLDARRRAADGERLVGAGEGTSRRGRARAARRKLSDA